MSDLFRKLSATLLLIAILFLMPNCGVIFNWDELAEKSAKPSEGETEPIHWAIEAPNKSDVTVTYKLTPSGTRATIDATAGTILPKGLAEKQFIAIGVVSLTDPTVNFASIIESYVTGYHPLEDPQGRFSIVVQETVPVPSLSESLSTSLLLPAGAHALVLLNTEDTAVGTQFYVPKNTGLITAAQFTIENQDTTVGLETLKSGSCPTNYLRISANTEVGVNDDFCVAKYEMKNDGSNNAVSQMAGLPYTRTRDDDIEGPGAISRCQEIGTGYDLISNSQWQAIAREIELVRSGTTYINWSGTPANVDTIINRGHSDASGLDQLAASTDDDPCFGTGNDLCEDKLSGDFSQKRTHTLFSGKIIWDIAGNAWEWVKDDNSTNQGAQDYVSDEPWDNTNGTRAEWGPKNSYTKDTEYGGLGYALLNSSMGAIIRGGGPNQFQQTGVFASYLGYTPDVTTGKTGFRCVITP